MKKLILDYSKWRAGGDDRIVPNAAPFEEYPNPNSIGKGNVALCNKQGYQCCLGQFSLQLNENLKPFDIEGYGCPDEVYEPIPDLNYLDERGFWKDTELSTKAMDINDDHKTTPDEKIVLLTNLFNTHGYQIKVINKP